MCSSVSGRYWNPTKLSLYLDGYEMNTIEIKSAAEPGLPNPFQQRVFMILNQAIGGTNGGDPSKTTFPLKFEVDYVRVYQGGTVWPPPRKPPSPVPAPPSPPGSETKQACIKACGKKVGSGCCLYEDSSGQCEWYYSQHVDGHTKAPGFEAANCYLTGECDGWNQNKRCRL